MQLLILSIFSSLCCICYQKANYITIHKNILIILGIVLPLNNSVYAASADNTFRVFDGTQYINRPDMRKYGIENITILYGFNFWKKNENQDFIPNTKRLIKLARKYDGKSKMIVLDIEHWTVQGHPLRPWIINNSIDKYIKTFNIFKAHAKISKIGYFGGIFPISNYKASIANKESTEYRTWEKDNSKMAGLAKIVDVAFPSVYTYSDDIKLWEKSFLAKVEQLRTKYTGEIFVFLWPQYFDHEPTPEHLQLKFIPADFWYHQLEFAQKHVDGVVIWGGWNFKKWKPRVWDKTAEWWLETKNFIKNYELNTSK